MNWKNLSVALAIGAVVTLLTNTFLEILSDEVARETKIEMEEEVLEALEMKSEVEQKLKEAEAKIKELETV